MDCFRKYSWLTGIHCHVGSQGCAVELLVRGARSVVDLAKEINELIGEGVYKQHTSTRGGYLPQTGIRATS